MQPGNAAFFSWLFVLREGARHVVTAHCDAAELEAALSAGEVTSAQYDLARSEADRIARAAGRQVRPCGADPRVPGGG